MRGCVNFAHNGLSVNVQLPVNTLIRFYFRSTGTRNLNRPELPLHVAVNNANMKHVRDFRTQLKFDRGILTIHDDYMVSLRSCSRWVGLHGVG